MRRFAFLAPIALAGSLLACSNSVNAPAMSHLTVMLTDAPGDISEAVVTISGIYLQGGPGEDSEDENSRVILLDEPVTTNLLTLVNDFQTLVTGVTVAAGEYGQLRFVIDGGYIVVETVNGSMVYSTPGYSEAPAQVDGTLLCPSCSQSGIKVNLVGGLTLAEGDETVVVDFDVADTFGQQAGNSGMWVMHPSLKTTDAIN